MSKCPPRKRLRILVGCERSGIVRSAFRKRGHDAWSCDLVPADDGSEFHFQCDIFKVLDMGWDMLIFFWPCTYLTRSGQQWIYKTPANPKPGVLYGQKRWAALLQHAKNFKKLLDCGIPKIAGENPRMNCHAQRIVGFSSQKIQPWEFGHGEVKETHLWLRNLPPLNPTKWSPERNQRIFKLGPSENRAIERSKTFQGVADAMAEQWAH